MFADYHVHTYYSDDSTYPMEDVVKDAIGMGMEEICFTDHVDYGIKVDRDWGQEIKYRNGDPFANVDYPRYMAEIAQMKNIYGDKIRIRTGLEFGMQMHTIPLYEKLFARYPFDFIILSVHQVEDKEFWTQDFQPCMEILKLYRDLGGRILTIGSDSHAPSHLGAYIREDSLVLKELGFRYFCTYENMEPVFHAL